MDKILIVDDDADICMLLERFLSRHDFEVETTFRGENAKQIVSRSRFDVVLSDFRLPDMDGLELLEFVKAKNPQTAVIIITGYSDVRVAINAMRKGAFDYVTKPIHPEEILLTIKKSLNEKPVKVQTSVAMMEEGPEEEEDAVDKTAKKARKNAKTGTIDPKQYIVGNSAQSKHLNQLTDLVAPTDMSVIIMGETGTGKEFVANAIHKKSKRKDKPFVAIDCGALPKELAGSELFGHKKGAFTGALMDKAGSFEIANGGTLFLDEIGNLSYENQLKLLRVLQERVIKRIGDTKDIPVDVRIIAATNENLWDQVKKGNFREDLYHRLNEFSLQLAPLRDRKTDIMQFADYFLDMANSELEKNIAGFSDEAKHKITHYYWHGNLRELRNVIKRAVLLSNGDKIEVSTLPLEIVNPSYYEDVQESLDMPHNVDDLKSVAEHAERVAIIKVLEKTAYNKTKTAEILNVDRKTLYNKMKAYGIAFEKEF